jgi:NifU-like protein involved in Fe-S cluster formation
LDFGLLQDHLSRPRHAGELPSANVIAEETNPICGDQIKLMLRVDKGRIAGVGWLAYGCPPTLACASALAETLQGQTLAAAQTITRRQIADALGGLPARKQHAAALVWETLQAALLRTVNAESSPAP